MRAGPTVPIIELQSLTRSYGSRRGIDDVSISVEEGALFGFLGPNGAGKTTAIRVVLGLLEPTRGTARVLGKDAWRESASIKRDVGYVPGDLRLYPWLTGDRALGIVSRVRGRDVRTHGRELAQMFELDLRVRVRKMSRGMRQKLGLILAMAHRPRLLVLDEPTVTLDPLMQITLQTHLRELAAQGHTIFFSSHTLTEVEQLCDRVAIIRDGRIVANETLDDLRSRAGHQVTIRFAAGTVPDEPPAWMTIVERGNATWVVILEGSVKTLIAWAAGQDLEDLRIERPDLETLFRRFYDGKSDQ